MMIALDPRSGLGCTIAGLVVALGLAAATASRVSAAPTSGLYGGLVLSVSGRRVSGAFSESRIGNGTDAAPQFTCEFLIHGRLFDNAATIVTQTAGGNEVISGRLFLKGDGVEMRLNDEPDGCGMTSGDMVHSPYAATRDSAGPNWIGAALVKVARAPLRPSPGTVVVRPYLVHGDAVAILARRGPWIQVAYPGGSKPARGWLSAKELDEAYAPPR